MEITRGFEKGSIAGSINKEPPFEDVVDKSEEDVLVQFENVVKEGISLDAVPTCPSKNIRGTEIMGHTQDVKIKMSEGNKSVVKFVKVIKIYVDTKSMGSGTKRRGVYAYKSCSGVIKVEFLGVKKGH